MDVERRTPKGSQRGSPFSLRVVRPSSRGGWLFPRNRLFTGSVPVGVLMLRTRPYTRVVTLPGTRTKSQETTVTGRTLRNNKIETDHETLTSDCPVTSYVQASPLTTSHTGTTGRNGRLTISRKAHGVLVSQRSWTLRTLKSLGPVRVPVTRYQHCLVSPIPTGV